jgi:fructokinase
LLRDVDILFANEAEVCALYEVNDFRLAVDAARADVGVAALTQSEAGSVIVRGGETVRVRAAPSVLVDSTGAGDAYAAGFLAAYTKGADLEVCGRLGSLAAAEVISHYGARPQGDLRELVEGLI